MTYAEIKNQYTSIESINTRLEEIQKEYDVYEKDLENMKNEYMEEVNDSLDALGINDGDIEWTCKYASPESIDIAQKDDNFYTLTIYAGYDIVYKNEYTDIEKVWKFQMNVASCGSFDIHNPSEKSVKTTAYYKLVANIMNEDTASHFEEMCKRWVDTMVEHKKSCRNLRSEEKQLELLKNNMEKEEAAVKYLETAKNTEDKTMVVIINKNAEVSDCVATHRGTPCSICSTPVELEKWEEEDKKCKKMNREDKSAKYIATRLQFLKFTK